MSPRISEPNPDPFDETGVKRERWTEISLKSIKKHAGLVWIVKVTTHVHAEGGLEKCLQITVTLQKDWKNNQITYLIDLWLGGQRGEKGDSEREKGREQKGEWDRETDREETRETKRKREEAKEINSEEKKEGEREKWFVYLQVRGTTEIRPADPRALLSGSIESQAVF